MGEFATNMGDLNESSEGDSPLGMFVGAGMDLDAISLSGAVAMTSNSYKANKFFTPTVLVGKAQPTAIINLGENTEAGTGDTTAIVLGASTKVSDEMGVGAKLMYAMWDNYPDDGNGGSMTEVDVTFSYAMGEKTKFAVAAGYGSPDDDAGDPDPVSAVSWTLSTSF